MFADFFVDMEEAIVNNNIVAVVRQRAFKSILL